MDAPHCSFDVLVLVFLNSLSRFELCCSLAYRLEAEVLEDLGRREVPVHLATANAFRSPLPLFILLDLVEELPLVAWVVGARHGAFFGPTDGIPVRALFVFRGTEVLPSVGQYGQVP